MKLVFFGTPEFALLPLRALRASEHDILAVVTQPDRESGRGRRIKSCPVKSEAQKAGMEILQPEKVRDPRFIQEMRNLAPQIIVVVAYGQILPREIIHLPERGCVNIHASLLPAYRGAAPINWAIINGEENTGVTTMLMDEGMDTGGILLQQATEISEEDSAGSLSLRLSKIGGDLLMKTLGRMEKGDITPLPQGSGVSWAPLLKKADGLIQWSKSSKELCRLINGMNPWPGAYGFLEDERIKILRALPLESTGSAGMIEVASKDQLVVGTGHGSLSIIDIQPAGKPVMPVKSFLQGRNLKEGMTFVV